MKKLMTLIVFTLSPMIHHSAWALDFNAVTLLKPITLNDAKSESDSYSYDSPSKDNRFCMVRITSLSEAEKKTPITVPSGTKFQDISLGEETDMENCLPQTDKTSAFCSYSLTAENHDLHVQVTLECNDRKNGAKKFNTADVNAFLKDIIVLK